MKFTIHRNEIQNVLTRIQGLTSRKSNLAITSSVLIQTAGTGIKITATDLETGFEGFYMADVEKEGKMAINSKKFYEIARDFPHETILINEIENNWIEIGNKNVEYHIVGMDSDEFPTFPIIENVPFFEMDAVTLKKMIEKTVIITGAGDEKRAHILGVYFEIIHNDKEKIIRLVSTDGNRMSTAECAMDAATDLPEEGGFIVPKKGLVELGKFMDYQGTVKVGFKENHFVMQKDGETLVIRLLEGAFPRYQDIIKSKGQGCVILFNKQRLLMMLKRMSILASEDYKGVVFSFLPDKLLIHSANPDIGESKEEMEIEYKGNSIEAVFNPRYFIESLNCIENDAVELNIINEEKPCYLEGSENKNYLSIIMPMRL
jgi:DNA polymerase III subunit beta